MSKIRIINRAFRVGAEVVNTMPEFAEKSLQFLFHGKAAVIGADRDGLHLF